MEHSVKTPYSVSCCRYVLWYFKFFFRRVEWPFLSSNIKLKNIYICTSINHKFQVHCIGCLKLIGQSNSFEQPLESFPKLLLAKQSMKSMLTWSSDRTMNLEHLVNDLKIGTALGFHLKYLLFRFKAQH
jgi:hypothetical protein